MSTPDRPTAEEPRDEAGPAHAVGLRDVYTKGDVAHLLNPLIGWLRLALHDGTPFTITDVRSMVARLSWAVRSEERLAARLAAQPPAADRDALDALACEDCSGPAPSKEVDPRDPLGIVTPNPKPTCPVPGFGRNHLWMTGAFYVGSRLIQSDDYMICGSCGQIEYDAPEEPTRPAPDTLAARVQADDLADALADAWPHLFNDGFAAEVAAFVMETIGGKS